MVRTGVKMPNFCLNRIRPHVRVRSPPIQFKVDANSPKIDENIKSCGDVREDNCGGGDAKTEVLVSGRKIMIVVDTSIEAKNAVHWALTHTVQNQDKLILLYVTKPSSKKVTGEESSKEMAHKVPQFLSSMMNSCKLKRPEVEIEVAIAQGKEKGPTIVGEAKKQEVALLILGQKKKRSMTTWRLLMMWTAPPGNQLAARGGVVEYCINNASCMAIAVRRKSRKVGGYLITTKRHKDFWLLA
ncbi:hypothetical protein LguiA_032556 [Lonicera macranthoides]